MSVTPRRSRACVRNVVRAAKYRRSTIERARSHPTASSAMAAPRIRSDATPLLNAGTMTSLVIRPSTTVVPDRGTGVDRGADQRERVGQGLGADVTPHQAHPAPEHPPLLVHVPILAEGLPP